MSPKTTPTEPSAKVRKLAFEWPFSLCASECKLSPWPSAELAADLFAISLDANGESFCYYILETAKYFRRYSFYLLASIAISTR
ncbi:MAG: hypothetical protein FD128_799 [Hyphomonadaceae bacterium]|nr:MAG: hypothetical protein FD128_799 [Hyphomonadaceae bacterium]